jgi:hypothetical protein
MINSSPNLTLVTSGKGIAQQEDERPPLVPERAYDLRFDYFETARMFGVASKLIMHFRIAEPGRDFDKPLLRFYNLTRIIGRPARSGRFKAGFHSDMLREFVTLFGLPAGLRLDRIPMSRFDGSFVRGTVRTVRQSNKQKLIPSALQYSVITELTALLR